jgi:transmembrane sensor
MAKVSHIMPRPAVEEAASRWIARLEADDVSQEDRLRFQAWLDEDAANRETFEAMRFTWHRLDALARVDAGRVAESSLHRPHGRRRHLPFAAAAALLLAVGATAWWVASGPDLVRYETAVGQQASVTLNDGSVFQLNTNTLLEVGYTDDRRSVELLRGEAHFEVARDARRPFVVHAGSGMIRAVGTAFNVYVSDEDAVEVTVTEGIVEVLKDDIEDRQGADSASARLASARITKNHKVSYDARGIEVGEVAAVPIANLDRRLAWRHGMLSFDGQTLDAVIREVSRYMDVQFEFADRSLGDVEVGGYFRATDTDAFLELLRSALGIESRSHGNRILLYQSDQNLRLEATRTSSRS